MAPSPPLPLSCGCFRSQYSPDRAMGSSSMIDRQDSAGLAAVGGIGANLGLRQTERFENVLAQI